MTMTADRTPKQHFAALSPGKLSGLFQITGADHRFRVLALDQSNSFRKALVKMHQAAGRPAETGYAEIRDVKLEMVRALAPKASAVLLDVNFGARQALSSFALPKGVGLIVRVEASKDPGVPGVYEPGWGVEKIKRMGASAVKLLVYLDVEDSAFTRKQLAFVEDVAARCAEQDILLMVEELTYPRPGEEKNSPEYWARKTRNVMESTKLLGAHADILKLEFPVDIKTAGADQTAEALERLDEAALRPWVLLSAGEDFPVFLKQVEAAMKAGCSGYMAGRAIFKEYFEQADAAARAEFLRTKGVERMTKLNEAVAQHATPWPDRYGLSPKELAAEVAEDWYLEGASAAGESEGKGDY